MKLHGTASEETLSSVEGTLLHFDRLGRQLGQDSAGSASSRALVPGSDVLDKADTNDAHAPLEVLSPRSDNGRKRNSSHTDQRLGLEVTEERKSVGSDVSGSVGVSKTGGDGRNEQGEADNDGDSPRDGLLVDSLAVREFGLHAGSGSTSVGAIDVDLNLGIEVRDGVCDAYDMSVKSQTMERSRLHTGNLADCVGRQYNVRVEVNLTLVHGAESSPSFLTRVEGLGDDVQAIGADDQVDGNVASDCGNTDDVEGKSAVVGGEGDIEQTGREVGVGHASTERRG